MHTTTATGVLLIEGSNMSTWTGDPLTEIVPVLQTDQTTKFLAASEDGATAIVRNHFDRLQLIDTDDGKVIVELGLPTCSEFLAAVTQIPPCISLISDSIFDIPAATEC